MSNDTETVGLSPDLATWLLEQLDADEAVALAASPGGWSYGGVEAVAGGTLYDETRSIAAVVYEQPGDHDGTIVRHLLSPEADANGAHIALHDPAHVLAQIAAVREVLHEYRTFSKIADDRAETTSLPEALTQRGVVVGLERALPALAKSYADRAGYVEVAR